MQSITVRGLAKRFGDVQAVKGLSFAVGSGELFGFLGPNGAGKTTTINMLTGLARPDTGDIEISGISCTGNPKAAQHHIGAVPDESNLYPELSGYENLCFCAALYGMRKKQRTERARYLLDLFGLSGAGNRKFSGFSKGMKRRLTLAAGIVHQPPILFLDEPTAGIDVASARQIRQLIAELNRNGTTVFLTTHHIEEAERLCDRIAFIVEGRIIRIDTVENLLSPLRENPNVILRLEAGMPDCRPLLVKAFPDIDCWYKEENQVHIKATYGLRAGKLVAFLEGQGFGVEEAFLTHPSLEDVFVRITGIEGHVPEKEEI